MHSLSGIFTRYRSEALNYLPFHFLCAPVDYRVREPSIRKMRGAQCQVVGPEIRRATIIYFKGLLEPKIKAVVTYLYS